MVIAHSRLTAQGKISVPSEVRKKLGVGPGSVIEWDERDDEVVVRRAGRYAFEDIHSALFPKGAPKPKSTQELKEGIRKHMRKHMRKKHAGR
jgi:AbrB family looped-hinge helix DNA binding protein